MPLLVSGLDFPTQSFFKDRQDPFIASVRSSGRRLPLCSRSGRRAPRCASRCLELTIRQFRLPEILQTLPLLHTFPKPGPRAGSSCDGLGRHTLATGQGATRLENSNCFIMSVQQSFNLKIVSDLHLQLPTPHDAPCCFLNVRSCVASLKNVQAELANCQVLAPWQA